jgi:antitoxin component of RelBE/YafQ-DinJ toxin-antitoxin module
VSEKCQPSTIFPQVEDSLMSGSLVEIRVRVEKELRQAFAQGCRAQGIAMSTALRGFMRSFIEQSQDGLESNLPADLDEQEIEAGLCAECGQLADDGEGYDGLCGSCADRLENAREAGRR